MTRRLRTSCSVVFFYGLYFATYLLFISQHSTGHSSTSPAAYDWCSFDTGEASIVDEYGRRHSVFVSATRDGSIWLRFGKDFAMYDWSDMEKRRILVQTSILEDDSLLLLRSLDYFGYCAVTDFQLDIHLESSWNPSFISVFDPGSKETKILSFKNIRDCHVTTSLSLTSDKQSLYCDGGGHNTSCGMRNLPPKGTASPTWFIRYINVDFEGPDHWYCSGKDHRNWYTLVGSYYYAYVRMAICNRPNESQSLGNEVKLRSRRDIAPSMTIIPDPTQTALSDAVLVAWQLYATTVSVEHSVHLQVWRPVPQSASFSSSSPPPSSPSIVSSNDSSIPAAADTFVLVGQTFVQPSTLRFQEIPLTSDQVIAVRQGDVLGLSFSNFSPIGWSSVPCSSVHQRHRILTDSYNLTTGQSVRFTVAPPGADACRCYSLRALFGNMTQSKVIDDWSCPGALLCSDSTSYKGTSVDVQRHKISMMTYNYSETGSRKNWRRVEHGIELKVYDESCSCSYLLLIVIISLVLVLTTVGFTSYQKALNS